MEPSLLPAMLAVSLTLDDAGRAPGSNVSGEVTISVPTRQMIRKLLQPHTTPQQQQQQHDAKTQAADNDTIAEEDDGDDADSEDADEDGGSAQPANVNGSGALETDSLLSNGHSAANGGSIPSPIAASSMLLAPLTRAFPLELRMQLMGRCIYDNERLYAPAMQRFATAAAIAPNGQGAKQTVFRMWSTRVAEVSVSADDCAAAAGGLPRTFSFHARLPSCLPPSFSGSTLKHVYYLQLLGVANGRKVLDVKLPFRVRVAHGGGASSVGSDKSAAHTLLATGRPQVVETPAGLVSSMQVSLTSPLPAFVPSAAAAESTSAAAAASASSTAADAVSNLIAPSPMQSSIPPLQLRLSVETGETPGPQNALSSGGAVPAPLSFGMTHSSSSSSSSSGSQVNSALSASAASKQHASSPAPAPAASESDQLLPRTRRPSFPLSPLLDTPLTFNLSKTVLVRTAAAAAPSSGSSLRDLLTGASPPPSTVAAPTEISAHVVKLTLDNRYTRPGDTVRGHLDFSAATIRCYRVNISLEQVETVAEDVARPELVSGSAAVSAAASSSKVYWRWHAYTVNTLSTHFTFCLPLDVLPNFNTDLVEVSWALRFQFITDVDCAAAAGGSAGGGAGSARASWSFLPAPSSTRAEPLKWVLPLMVLPNDEDARAQPLVKTVLCTPNSVV